MKKNILKAKLKQIFNKYKLSKKHSEICADYLIKAELVEAKSHGLTRLKILLMINFNPLYSFGL